jgi:hypothetical protein
VKAAQEQERPVALKLAVHAEDPRFEREAALLSRLDDPNIPRLLEHGRWQQGERAWPYLVMEWVEGTPLYEWAATRNPTSRQLMELLAQMAWALAAIHAQDAVHRDVKGDNVLVGPDFQAFLTDLGSCTWPGASPLTREPLPPGTAVYWSPEAWRFAKEHGRQQGAHYDAQPSDDVFALGVTAYRLVTDEYPPSTDPSRAESRIWHVEGRGPRPPAELNPRINSWLSALIMRMLSVRPEQRGSAAELAEMLEQEAAQADGEANLPAFAWQQLEPAAWPREEAAVAVALGYRPRHRIREKVYAAEAKDGAAREEAAQVESKPQDSADVGTGSEESATAERRSRLFLHVAGAGLCVVLGFLVSSVGNSPPVDEEVVQVDTYDEETWDGGTAEQAITSYVGTARMPREHASLRLEMPKEPFPGQLRSEKGKCQRRGQVAINGGCWIPIRDLDPPCAEDGYEWKGSCYYPVTAAGREPATDPP